MTEVIVLPEQLPPDNPERRNIALAERLGISLLFYSQIVEDAVAHAIEPRPAVPAIAPEQRWLQLGPRNVGGRITAIAQDPTNPLVLYAGSAHGGLWQTLDGGDTWEHLGEDEHNFPISAIAIPEQDPTTLYIGTGLPVTGHASGRGLYRVTVPAPRIPQPGVARPRAVFNRLARPHPPNMTPLEASRNPQFLGGALRYTRIRMDPFDGERFWAASQTGLWRFEPRPASGAARFILEFPPNSIASGDGVPPLFGGVLGAGGNYPAYASDVAVARDPRDTTPVSEGSRIPRYLVIYVAIDGVGVYRGRFDRVERTTTWERRCAVPPPAQPFARIQLALCERTPQRVYALMNDTMRLPTAVYRSDDSGENWRTMPRPFDALQNQAEYNLVLEVSPTDPDIVWVGVIDCYLSRDGGATWQKVLFSREYDGTGDYAQHADQHAAVFDRFERRKLWAGHDGGLSLARDLQLPPRSPGYWRMRSHGIIGTQFQDVAVNYGANRGFMTAAGAQDNGGWMSLGGPTWIHVNAGDGAGYAFHPTNTRNFLASLQNQHHRVRIFLSTAVRSFFNPVVPDVPDTLAPLNAMAIGHIILAAMPGGPLTGAPSPFVPIVVQNPAAPNSVIFGWQTTGMFSAANFTINFGVTINPLVGIGAIAPAGIQCSAAAFGPRNSTGNFEGWVGFTNGNLALTQNAPSGAWAAPATALPWGPAIAAQQISGIVIHPTDERIVLVCTPGTPGRVFITYDRGTSWQELTARLPNAVAVAPANLNLAAGQRRQYTATANFPDGGGFDATAHVIWTTNDPTIARFSMVAGEEGQLITVAPGMVTVRARFALFGANVDGTTMLTVTAGAGAPPPLPTAPRAFDLRALPRCPMTSLAFDQTTPTRVFVGTLAGVYTLPNIPVPMSLTVTPNPANIVVGETRQLTVMCRFSDGVDRDITTQVDWSAVPAPPAVVNFGVGPLGSQVIGAAIGSTRVTARRGALSADTIVNVAAGPAPAAPGPPAAAVAPVVPINWQPFSLGLPLTLVNDITNVPGTNMLRVATFGRGVWDCDLAATPMPGTGTRPRRQLFIRQTVIEDGLTYPRPFPPVVVDDPRLPIGTVALDHAHAFDIRVDAPPYRFFEDRVDGVEFDERIGADTLVPMVNNSIYVQVLNAGREAASNVRVHLYFRRSPVAAPIGAAAIPLPTAAGADLGNVAEFYNAPSFDPPGGGSPADGLTWTRVGPARMLEPVGPAAPVVARFDWAPPAGVAGRDIALLALCESPDDPLPLAAIAGPGVSAFVPAERRCALRILPVAALARPDLFIRGGIDDDGRRNSIAAAAATRSPDIIIVQAEPADPRAAFRDLIDLRRQDRLVGNVTNHLYVRVHNRGRSTVQAEAEVWAVKVLPNLHPEVPHGRWTRAGAAMIDVPANDWALAHITFAMPVDPAPLEFERKHYILVALIRSTDNNDPFPDRTVVTTEDQFQQFISRQAGSDNIAARAVRWVAS